MKITIKTNDIDATTIPAAIAEIESKYNIYGDAAEAAASHIIYTDTDYTYSNDK